MNKHFLTCLFISGSVVLSCTTTTDALAARRNDHHAIIRQRHNKRKRTQYRPLAHRQGQHPFQVELDLQQAGGYTHIIGSDDSGAGCIAGPIVTVSLCCCCNKDSDNKNDDSNSNITIIPGVMDSKLLTSTQRQDIYQQVIQAPPEHYCWAYAVRSNHEIDQIVAAAATAAARGGKNGGRAAPINKVTQECFAESIQAVVSKLQQQQQLNDITQPYSFYSIVDGKHSPAQLSASSPSSIPSRPWKQADTVVYTVALASILARVIRDNIMSQQLAAAAENNNDVVHQRYHFDQHGGYPTAQHIAALHQYGPCPLFHRTSSQPVQKWRAMQQYTISGRREAAAAAAAAEAANGTKETKDDDDSSS